MGVVVKAFFEGTDGFDDDVCEWSGIRRLTDVVEGVITPPFVDAVFKGGCYNRRCRYAICDEAGIHTLFNFEEVVGFATCEMGKEMVFDCKGLAVGQGNFPYNIKKATKRVA